MKKSIYLIISLFILISCNSTSSSVLGNKSASQVQMRSYQSRSFESENKGLILKSIISTMQDLGFIIDKADEKLGVVSGTSFTNSSKLTVSVRSAEKGNVIVRANAQVNLKPITDPIPYQNFFNALSQSLFLEAHLVD